MPKQLPKIYFKKCYVDSILPSRKMDDDVGEDVYIHHATQYEQNTEIETPIITERSIGFTADKKEEEIEVFSIEPQETVVCYLGFATAIPTTHYGTIVPRSGLASKFHLTITNTPATIDPNYRGEWGAIVTNLGKKPVKLRLKMRIAQLIIRNRVQYERIEVDTLPESDRGSKKFGSSGY